MNLDNFTIATGSLLRTKVYLGKTDKKKSKFLSKKDITAEFLSTIIDYIGENETIDVNDEDGQKLYEISVRKV